MRTKTHQWRLEEFRRFVLLVQAWWLHDRVVQTMPWARQPRARGLLHDRLEET